MIENQTRKDKDWNDIVLELKKAFISYPMEVGWNSHRFPSTAEYGNILEAINTALNMLQLHYMDRDLKRSGNSIVLVSAGSGRFVVDKGIAEITEQRMMVRSLYFCEFIPPPSYRCMSLIIHQDNGIGSDVLSLGLPPLHVAPFFIYTVSFFIGFYCSLLFVPNNKIILGREQEQGFAVTYKRRFQ